MKRETGYRRTLATAVVVLILLGSPVYGRAKKDQKDKSKSPKTTIERLVVWVQTRIVPPWPEPDPTTTDMNTSTDVVTTTT